MGSKLHIDRAVFSKCNGPSFIFFYERSIFYDFFCNGCYFLRL